MSSAVKQPTVVVLLPHELAAIVTKLRALREWGAGRTGEPTADDTGELLDLMTDVCEAARVAFHHAIGAPEPDNVMVVLGTPLHIHDGSAK